MTPSCPREELEAFVRGELPAPRAAELAAHAAACAECGREVAWLRAEIELLAGHAGAAGRPPLHLWDGIAARVEPRSPAAGSGDRPRRGRSLAWAGVALVAAAGTLLIWHASPPPRLLVRGGADAGAQRLVHAAPDAIATAGAGASQASRDPVVAVDRAEREYAQAVAVLEAELHAAARRSPTGTPPSLRSALAAARAGVAAARASAGRDPEARLAVLDSYELYVRSLQLVVAELEEVPR